MLMYRKNPIVSPGLICPENFFGGLFLGGWRGWGEAYYWKEFCVSKWIGLDNKNSLKQFLKQATLTAAGFSSLAFIYSGGLMVGGFCD